MQTTLGTLRMQTTLSTYQMQTTLGTPQTTLSTHQMQTSKLHWVHSNAKTCKTLLRYWLVGQNYNTLIRTRDSEGPD
jgi:hypothetical protein